MSLVIAAANAAKLTCLVVPIQYLFLFILPFLYPFIFKAIREHQFLGITTPFPTAWDEFFSTRKKYWIRVHFKDDTLITGWYGPPHSASSQYPEKQQLYLSEIWQLNAAGIMEKMDRTAGMLVSMSEVQYLEFLT
jgi:hypothetical protein